jgi:hypothetical protein
MPASLRTSKLFHSVGRLLLVGALAACRSATPAAAGPDAASALPRRLVLALDGVDYRDLETARARGLFRAFHPPARMISTFPSISDIAWHAIFDLQPPAGYQRIFYSLHQNAVVGEQLDQLRPIEYERRMDAAFDTKFHHFGAYLISGPTARREVDTDARIVLRTRGRETVYVYNVGPDALQHTHGDMAAYLAHLDSTLTQLLSAYRQRTGRELEVLVLSDHGHNHAAEATFLPVTEALKARGFVTARSVKQPNQVVFSVDGVTTGFGVFCHPDSVERVARILSALTGVDVVTRQVSRREFEVRSSAGRATVLYDDASTPRYAYRSTLGDPLALDSVVARMRADGVASPDGFADAATWLRYTATLRYPVAPPRIVHGHRFATRNPAPILVSLDDRYRVGLGMMSITDRLFGLGGTHGALSATNSVGIAMSNVRDLPDVLAMTAREQLGGFDGLREPSERESTLRLATVADLRGDRLARTRWNALPASVGDSTPLLVLRVGDRRFPLPGDSLWFEVSIRRKSGGRLLATTALPATRWLTGGDQREWAIPARLVQLADLTPGETYVVQIRADGVRARDDGGPPRWSRVLVTTEMLAAPDGLPWTY